MQQPMQQPIQPLLFQREQMKLFFANGFERNFAQAVAFILKHLPPKQVSEGQWREMCKLFRNETPYTIQALNRESILFKLGYVEVKDQSTFDTFQNKFRNICWEVTNREEFEPLVEILTGEQMAHLVSLAFDKWKANKTPVVLPTKEQIIENVHHRTAYSHPWFTTVSKHEWKRPDDMQGCPAVAMQTTDVTAEQNIPRPPPMSAPTTTPIPRDSWQGPKRLAVPLDLPQ